MKKALAINCVEKVELIQGFRFNCLDPFFFCVYHKDLYPVSCHISFLYRFCLTMEEMSIDLFDIFVCVPQSLRIKPFIHCKQSFHFAFFTYFFTLFNSKRFIDFVEPYNRIECLFFSCFYF